MSVNLETIASVDNLRRAWLQIRARARRDSFRDLSVIDPLEWLDFELLLDQNLHRVARAIASYSYTADTPNFLQKAKGSGLTRPISVLSIDDQVVFQAAILPIAPLTKHNRWPGSFAMIPTGNPGKPFESWYEQWPEFQEKIRNVIAEGKKVLAVTDIVSYFEYIDHRVLETRLQGVEDLDPAPLKFLLYLLERWTFRPRYATNRLCGLPQLDHDAPRFLADFFLTEHDHTVGQKCPDYMRWMDDMVLPSNTAAEARRALRTLDASLREHYLTPNAGKTEVLQSAQEIADYFWFEENDFLRAFETSLRASEAVDQHAELERILRDRFEVFWGDQRRGHWDKVLRRYITMFKRLDSDYLLDRLGSLFESEAHLEDKLFDYLLGISWRSQILKIAEGYLTSSENIYDSVEIGWLRLLLLHRVPTKDGQVLASLGTRIFFQQAGYKPNSWYAGVLGAYLVGKYGPRSQLRRVLKHVASIYEKIPDPIARRHLLVLGFLLKADDTARTDLYIKGRGDPDRTVQSLWQFHDNLFQRETAIIPTPIVRRLTVRKLFAPNIAYFPFTRLLILTELARKSEFYAQLKPIVEKLVSANQDPIIRQRLSALTEEVG